ncbi:MULTISPECIES: GNAT family N-acetyltransferase [unclassified Colwellia]|uniref:GNAT family N-acetyltransferase n=1 Tax=unclassified Colwellia TaxID=196834 RepID=UPI0015F7621B|nr:MULTISPECIES: GNAT family N-acetyltransferase [unclassified Colwellia]MBA6222658.1 GNAT family N-acetyltransferase [Colwellia sp. MB3u-45]MBA6266228.1 GNAT family N-acetyltransferase [Colwellia sp. MB3u-43]MBA6287330.1 GNAT family N-acetyltransferase [Colwellia sp. MB3u-4]MBA6322621.1 GNAT family N-acetyltransferase [Colwellia sp. MB02u-19]MBA6326319.1 GNAT family N-acetyltransferase [Colwellia sp. MB02u-18]
MNPDAPFSPYTVIKAVKTDKKDILRFYKNQQYAASFIGHDQCYIVKMDKLIIASVIISAGQEPGSFWLLHGLVTDKAQRGKNIASLMLHAIISDKNERKKARYKNIICFADEALQTFYLSNHFIHYNTRDDIAQLPIEFKQRLIRYRERQKNLHCFRCSVND